MISNCGLTETVTCQALELDLLDAEFESAELDSSEFDGDEIVIESVVFEDNPTNRVVEGWY